MDLIIPIAIFFREINTEGQTLSQRPYFSSTNKETLMSEKTKLLSNNISFQQFVFRRVPEKMKEKDTKLKKQSMGLC